MSDVPVITIGHQPLDQLYSIKESLKSLLDEDEKKHEMDQVFSATERDKLDEAYTLMAEIYDFDPTPQHLWDHSGGEPPVTMKEMHEQAYQQKYGS